MTPRIRQGSPAHPIVFVTAYMVELYGRHLLYNDPDVNQSSLYHSIRAYVSTSRKAPAMPLCVSASKRCRQHVIQHPVKN